jgi:type I restriction enzyme S subunit
MEVRSGYKQTDAGIIPEEWHAHCIEDFAVITTGSKNTQDRVDDGQYPFFVRSQTIERINSYSFDGEAVLTAGDGVGTGKVFHYINGRFDAHQRVYRISNFAEYVNGYFFYLNFSSRFYNRIMQMTAKSSVDSVRREMISRMQVALPPTKAEQHAIAQAICDADSLITALDRLITKKRDIKQATMQQLLTGKTRLPGFSGKWEVKLLGDIAEIVSGGTPRTNVPSYWNGSVKWCTPTDITRHNGKVLIKTDRTISKEGLDNSGARLLPEGALLLCSRATIGEIKIAGEPMCTNQGFKSLICHADVCNEFLYYKLLTMKPEMIGRSFGSTFLEISTRNVSALAINTPPKDEQAAIAAVLSDMDAELTALEARRDKTRAIKQGMMQELLTGNTRLI